MLYICTHMYNHVQATTRTLAFRAYSLFYDVHLQHIKSLWSHANKIQVYRDQSFATNSLSGSIIIWKEAHKMPYPGCNGYACTNYATPPHVIIPLKAIK